MSQQPDGESRPMSAAEKLRERHRTAAAQDNQEAAPALKYKFDTQLLVEGKNLSEDEIHDGIEKNIPGDCLLAFGSDEIIKIDYHTNIPWKVLEYCATKGEIFDVVVENMERQQNGKQG